LLECPPRPSDIIAVKTIVFTKAAARDFDALPFQAREAVTLALTTYAIEGRGDVKKLTGRDGFRLRVGDYRVIFNEDQTTILAIFVGRRSTTTYRRT
jgi:mRNA interferase RelE/StbE